MTNTNESILHSIESSISTMTTKLETKFNDQMSKIDDFRSYVGTELTEIKKKLETITNRLDQHDEFIQKNSNQIELISTNTSTNTSLIENIQNQLQDMEDELKKLNTKSIDLGNQIDNNINRSMRSTLIIKGLPEDKTKNETWKESTEKLVATITTIDKSLNKTTVANDIERAHRGGKSIEDKPRLLFVKFHSWKKSELYKSIICNHSLKNKNSTIYADQMYSREVTSRRNEALLYRRQLIDNGELGKLFVKFPAKLMIKRENDTNYKLLKEF